MYRLYIDYGNGYEREKEDNLEKITEKIENTNYIRCIVIKNENNTDEVIYFDERQIVFDKRRKR